MSLLEHPDAQALLADAVVTPDEVRGCQDRISTFLRRYLPRSTAPSSGPTPRSSSAASSSGCSERPASRSPSRPASTGCGSMGPRRAVSPSARSRRVTSSARSSASMDQVLFARLRGLGGHRILLHRGRIRGTIGGCRSTALGLAPCGFPSPSASSCSAFYETRSWGVKEGRRVEFRRRLGDARGHRHDPALVGEESPQGIPGRLVVVDDRDAVAVHRR